MLLDLSSRSLNSKLAKSKKFKNKIKIPQAWERK